MAVTRELTDDEIEALSLAVIRGHEEARGRGATEDEIAAVVRWAEDVRVEAALLRLILSGEVVVTAVDDDGDFTLQRRDEDAE